MNVQERVTRILKQPRQEWPVIEAEPTDIATLYKSYIVPLAAIPVVANFLGRVVFGVSVPFVGRYRFGVADALRAAVFEYIGALAGVFVAAFVVSKLAPTFASRDDQRQALKLVAYASTPVWVAGVLNLIPLLGVFVIFAALYCIYVYYLGVAVMMKTPPDKVIAYMVVSLVVIIIVYLVLGFIMGVAGGMGGGVPGGAR